MTILFERYAVGDGMVTARPSPRTRFTDGSNQVHAQNPCSATFEGTSVADGRIKAIADLARARFVDASDRKSVV